MSDLGTEPKNHLLYRHLYAQVADGFPSDYWLVESDIVCGFSHPSAESRRCNGHENVMDYFDTVCVLYTSDVLICDSLNMKQVSIFIYGLRNKELLEIHSVLVLNYNRLCSDCKSFDNISLIRRITLILISSY